MNHPFKRREKMATIVKVTIELNDGRVWTTTDPLDLRKIDLCLPRHINWKEGASADTLRNKYFLLLTELVKHLKTGDTKTDMHEQIKPLVMQRFMDFPQYFTNNQPEYSTRHLTRQGWIAFIEQFKSVALDVFGYIFKE